MRVNLRRDLWPLLLGLLVILPAGLITALERFDGLYGQDSFAYFDYTIGPLRESLLQLRPPPPAFWPPGYPLLVGLASLVIGPIPLAGQIVSLLAGALVPVSTALLARELCREAVGGSDRVTLLVPLVAGLVAASCGQLWQSSTVVMTDTTGLAFATAGVWALARYGRGGRGGWLLLAATLLAYATLTRWIYGLVSVLCILYALTILARREPRVAALHGGVAALCAGLLLAPVLLPALTGLLERSEGGAPFAGSFEDVHWHPRHFVARESPSANGTQHFRLPNGLFYALAPAHWAYFTPVLAPLLLPGLWAVIRQPSAALLLLVVGWAALVYILLAGGPVQNFRYTLTYLPPLAILIGLGLNQLLQLGNRHLARVAGIYLALGLATMAAAGTRATLALIAGKNDHLETVRWTEAHVPPDARLLTFSLTLTFRHYSRLEILELFELDPAELAVLLQAPRPTFVLVDAANLEHQWSAWPPGVNFRWLQEHPGLVTLGTRHGYTLYRVGADPGGVAGEEGGSGFRL